MDASAGNTPVRAARGMLGPRAIEYARVIGAQGALSPDVVLALLAHAYYEGLIDGAPNPASRKERRGR